MTNEPSSLGSVVGARLRETREAEGLTQEDLARLARDAGLTWWRRSTVAQLETGRREAITLAELWGLSLALDVDPAHWLNAAIGTTVALTPDLSAPAAVLAASLAGVEASEWRSPGAGWKTPASRRGTTVDVPAAGDAEQKAARALGTSPRRLAELSIWRWGRSFTAERDARLAVVAPPDADRPTLTALRGHVSRALRAELAPHLG